MIGDIRKELIQLMKIESSSGHEPGIIEYLEKRLRRLGYSPEIQYSGDVINLILGDSDLLIATHVDTIRHRADLREENDRVYGTGACDAKGSIVAILTFLESISTLNVSIAFLSDEEDGGRGSEVFLDHTIPGSAIVMEPTSLRLCTSHAGNIEIEFMVAGEEAHGSCAEDGVNAIERAINMYFELKSMISEKIGKSYCNISFQEILGENPFYLIPDTCSGRIEVRLPPEENAEIIAGDAEKILKKFCREYRFRELWSGYKLAEDHPLIELFRKAGIQTTDWMKSWTDALNFNKKGVPAVVFGPGDLSVAHTRKEHIELGEIVRAVEILKNINRYAPELYPL